jgi:hypothetical protein
VGRAEWDELVPRFGEDVLVAVTRGIDGNAAKMREVLEDFERLVTNVKAWRGGSSPSMQWLNTDEKLRPVLRQIFSVNFEPVKGKLRNLNPQDFLRDMAQISYAPSFVPSLKQLQKTDKGVMGIVAEVREAAKDFRTLGRFDPEMNPVGFRDINSTIYTGQGKKITDFDILSDGTVWSLKTGAKSNRWNSKNF